MSGIVGILHGSGRPVDPSDLRRMNARLAHRGPDRSGVCASGPAGLGHSLLTSTPEARHETLPLRIERSELTITADARIDNREELVRELEIPPPARREITDAELILRAYESWGTDCPRRLLGDFAFAVWDARNRRLFAARDPFGVRPFYYHSSPGLFAFASEAPALLALDRIPKVLDETRIADSLLPGLEAADKTRTFYREIRRLPPASILIANGEQTLLSSYWRLDPEREIRRPDDEDYVEEFGFFFRRSLECRLRSSSPPGSMLSGGLDSSAIVGVSSRLLAREGRGPLHTFSVKLPGDPRCAETRAIDRMTSIPGIHPHPIHARRIDAFDSEPCHPHGADDPFDATMTLPRAVYSAARRAGVRGVLDGVDGDYVASHEPDLLSYLIRDGAFTEAWHEAFALARFYRGYYAPWSSPLRLLGRSLRGALVPASLCRVVRSLRGDRRARQAIRASIIRPEFAMRAGVPERLDGLSARSRPATLRERQAAEIDHPNLVVALERYDRVAAAYGVEPRHPFLDRRLVEFCLALPWEQKLSGGWTKRIVRRAMQGILPREVAWRRGRWEGLGARCTSSLMRTQEARLGRFVARELDDLDCWVDVGAVRRAYHRYLNTREPEAGEKVWQAAKLAWWLQSQASISTAEKQTA